LCLTPYLTTGLALLLGVIVALTVGNPFTEHTRKLTHKLLSIAVIGLGAGMNILIVAKVGLQGIGYTVIGIATTFVVGTMLGRAFRLGRNTSLLITVGTAICGGSAIAAVAPVLRAKSHETSVSLAVVFLLNACALFMFPLIGHQLNLSEHQFGLWSALAIHDTSSVVGATMQYGREALELGTTVKLARALWIVPVTLAVGALVKTAPLEGSDNNEAQKRKYPWFILGFLLMAALVTWVPALANVGHYIEMLAKRILVLTLFLIGANLTRETLRTVGVAPFVDGVTLWFIVGASTLFAIYNGFIH